MGLSLDYEQKTLVAIAASIGIDPTGKSSAQLAAAISTYITFSRDNMNNLIAALGGGTVTQIALAPSDGQSQIVFTSSTFSGWRAQASDPTNPPQNFNQITFGICPFDSAHIPTQARVILRDADNAGAILTEVTLSLAISITGPTIVKNVTAVFPIVVANASGHRLELEVLTDGRMSPKFALHPWDLGTPNTLYSTAGSLVTPCASVATSNFNWWAQYARVDYTSASFATPSDAAGKLTSFIVGVGGGSGGASVSARLRMPSVKYALEGRECNIYFKNIFDCRTLKSEQVSWDVTCAKGKQEDIRWTYTPQASDAGSTTITIDCKYGDTIIASWTGTLVTKALLTSGGVSRKLLTIGDSTLAGGQVLAELINLFSPDTSYTLTTVGKLSTTVNDAGTGTGSGATSRTPRHEAIAGKSINFFYTDITSVPPSDFMNAGVFDFAHYLSANGITMAAGDIVEINLGINDVFGYADDTAVNAAIAIMITQLTAMIANIRAAVSGIRILLLMPTPPNSSQDPWAIDYGDGQTRDRYFMNIATWWANMIQTWGAATANNIYLIAYHSAIDTVRGFPSSAVAWNSRTTATYLKSSAGSGLHPGDNGYWQLADELRSTLKGLES